jgi:iron complex transport system substrate-binding protein
MRSPFITRSALVLVAAAALTLAACGSDSTATDGTDTAGTEAAVDSAASDTAAPPATTATADTAGDTAVGDTEPEGTDAPADAAQFPVTIETIFGDVTVEEEPVRIVALGWGDAETALALGVEPVGATDWVALGGDGVGPWSAQYTTPPEIIPSDFNFEQIAALEPDLILNTAADGSAETNDLLSQIAPTVAIPAGDTAWGTPWEHQVATVAAALGKTGEGQALIDEVNAAFADAAEANPEFAGKSVVVAPFYNGGWGAYMSKDVRVSFMENLGFVNSDAVEALDEGSFYITVSAEQLELLDADLTVAFPFTAADIETIEADPLFQTVPSVADGRSVVLTDPDTVAAFNVGSASALLFAIEKTVPQFATAMAG